MIMSSSGQLPRGYALYENQLYSLEKLQQENMIYSTPCVYPQCLYHLFASPTVID